MKRILPSVLLALVSLGLSAQSFQSDAPCEESLCASEQSELRAGVELGPYTTEKFTLTSQKTPGFGGATIYLPKQGQDPADPSESSFEGREQFPSLTMIPGYVCPRKTIEWLAPIVASHGFVVMVMDARTIFDQPSRRSAAMVKALSFLTDASPVKDSVDPERMAIWGHSMGGGATLETASKLPNVKAAIAVAPYHNIKSFPGITQPTLVITSSVDFLAPANAHGKPMFNSLVNATEKEYKMLSAGHMAAVTKDQRIAQMTLDWLKRYL